MAEAGCSIEQLIAVVRAHEDKIERKSRAHAERQKRYRDRKRDTTLRNVTQRDARDVTLPLPPTVYSNNIYPPSQPIVPLDSLERVKRAPSARGARLAPTWEPDEKGLSMGREVFGSKLTTELESFRDYWAAQPGSKGIKTDWQATWRNWCRRAGERVNVTPFPSRGYGPNTNTESREPVISREENIARMKRALGYDQ